MKGDVVTELKKKTNEELMARCLERKRELYDLRCKAATSGEKVSSHKLRLFRQEIARVLTVLRERELQMNFREPLL